MDYNVLHACKLCVCTQITSAVVGVVRDETKCTLDWTDTNPAVCSQRSWKIPVRYLCENTFSAAVYRCNPFVFSSASKFELTEQRHTITERPGNPIASVVRNDRHRAESVPLHPGRLTDNVITQDLDQWSCWRLTDDCDQCVCNKSSHTRALRIPQLVSLDERTVILPAGESQRGYRTEEQQWKRRHLWRLWAPPPFYGCGIIGWSMNLWSLVLAELFDQVWGQNWSVNTKFGRQKPFG